jgi:hypothetical protein
MEQPGSLLAAGYVGFLILINIFCGVGARCTACASSALPELMKHRGLLVHTCCCGVRLHVKPRMQTGSLTAVWHPAWLSDLTVQKLLTANISLVAVQPHCAVFLRFHHWSCLRPVGGHGLLVADHICSAYVSGNVRWLTK